MSKIKPGKIWIGTSNVVVPGNKQHFPPAFQNSSRLHYYGSLFNSVELNTTFYKIPMRKTFEKWSLEVPEDFQFSIKLNKEITHAKKLSAGLDIIDRFVEAADGLGNKKGCLLIQFPGKITLDYYDQVAAILLRIQKADQHDHWRTAVEFRHSSWYIGETYELLNESAAAIVLHDIVKGKNADILTKASFVDIRFHGPSGDYRSSYADADLEKYATKIMQWSKEGKSVYAYFNNTIGNAFENANYLGQLVMPEK